MTTYDSIIGLIDGEFTTARDDNGHGTHTASTAAGNRGVRATIFGVDRGTVSGIAPRAHVMVYKVCGDAGCFFSDSAAAVGEAIEDGVDVNMVCTRRRSGAFCSGGCLAAVPPAADTRSTESAAPRGRR
jgi:subtilisin family serine protease